MKTTIEIADEVLQRAKRQARREGKTLREVVAIPEPFYYAGAANVFAKKSSGLKSWSDLKGKPICAIQGAYYNRRTGEEFGAQLVVFKGVTEAMSALEGGNCVGVVFDTTFFAGIAGDAKWADYAMVLPSIDPEPWGMGVRKDDPKFAAYMSDVSKDWHKTGFILGLEKKWGIPQSPFFETMAIPLLPWTWLE